MESRTIAGPEGDIAAKIGRPLDPAVTVAMLDATLHLLAENGLSRVTSEAVAAHARAGKAGVYRRWPSTTALVAEAISTCALIPRVGDNGSLRGDLIALLEPWTRPLTRCERAAGALLGHAGRNTELDQALDANVVLPLAGAVDGIASRHARREQQLPDAQIRLLGTVVQSLWWQRYTGHSDPSHAAGVTELVDHVLLPVATGH